MPAQAWREVALPAFVIDVHRTLYVSGSMRVTLQERGNGNRGQRVFFGLAWHSLLVCEESMRNERRFYRQTKSMEAESS